MNGDLIEHYATAGLEGTRLRRSAHGRLEFLRTRELVRRFLPPRAGLRVLDVGGATGVHAEWLAADRHDVHVIDPVPSHVATAAALPGVTATVGDARSLAFADDSADVVLMFGPLYHLTVASDRAAALAEAARVLRPGGLLVAAGISRYLSLMEFGSDGHLTAADEATIGTLIATGAYDGHAGFMRTHFHMAAELRREVAAAFPGEVAVYGVEGPTWPALDAAGLDAFGTLVDSALRAARLVEQDPLLINASAHLLAVARKVGAA